MENNNTKQRALDKRALISTLWIFLSVNYIFCDLLSNMDQSTISSLLEGHIAGIPMNQSFLLFAGISLEIPFMMIVLSRVLPFKINKYANMTAAILMIFYQLASFFVGTGATLHYIFFSTVEILGNLTILILAIKWQASSNQ